MKTPSLTNCFRGCDYLSTSFQSGTDSLSKSCRCVSKSFSCGVRLKRCCETFFLNWEWDGWVASSALLCYQKARPPRLLGSLFNVIGMVWFEMAVDQVRSYIQEWVKLYDDDEWWWVMMMMSGGECWWRVLSNEEWWVMRSDEEWDVWWVMSYEVWEQVLQPGIEHRS